MEPVGSFGYPPSPRAKLALWTPVPLAHCLVCSPSYEGWNSLPGTTQLRKENALLAIIRAASTTTIPTGGSPSRTRHVPCYGQGGERLEVLAWGRGTVTDPNRAGSCCFWSTVPRHSPPTFKPQVAVVRCWHPNNGIPSDKSSEVQTSSPTKTLKKEWDCVQKPHKYIRGHTTGSTSQSASPSSFAILSVHCLLSLPVSHLFHSAFFSSRAVSAPFPTPAFTKVLATEFSSTSRCHRCHCRHRQIISFLSRIRWLKH